MTLVTSWAIILDLSRSVPMTWGGRFYALCTCVRPLPRNRLCLHVCSFIGPRENAFSQLFAPMPFLEGGLKVSHSNPGSRHQAMDVDLFQQSEARRLNLRFYLPHLPSQDFLLLQFLSLIEVPHILLAAYQKDLLSERTLDLQSWEASTTSRYSGIWG